jgi:ammonium transporter Rh
MVNAGCKMGQTRETDGDVQSSLLPILNGAPFSSSAASLAWDMQRMFPSVLGTILAALLVCFVSFTKYSDRIDTEEFYMYYMHVAIMIFVGFGFLMTFLKRYSLGAVSLNFVASCMMMLAGILLV